MDQRRRTKIIKVVRIKIFAWLLIGWTYALVHELKKGEFYYLELFVEEEEGHMHRDTLYQLLKQ